MKQPLTTGIVKQDSRGRVSLAKFGVKPGDLFLMRKEGGKIILEPAVVVPLREISN